MAFALPAAVRRHLDPVGRYGLRVTLAVAALVLVTVPFATLLFEVLAKGPLTRLDGSVANGLNHWVHDSPNTVRALEAVSWMGRPPMLWTVVAIAALVAWRHHARRITTYLLVTTTAGGILSSVVKVLVDRPRPEVDHPIVTALGKSFPSGHALSSTVCYGAVLLAYLPVIAPRWRRLAVVATAGLVLAIGTSRLLLGVHFLSDVLAGFVLGGAWLIAATAIFETWRVERGRRPSHPVTEGVEPEESPV
jgi:membrane-associated phospholipid phosphatase